MHVYASRVCSGWLVLVILLPQLTNAFVFDKKWLQTLRQAYNISGTAAPYETDPGARHQVLIKGKISVPSMKRKHATGLSSVEQKTWAGSRDNIMMRSNEAFFSADGVMKTKQFSRALNDSVPSKTWQNANFLRVMRDVRTIFLGLPRNSLTPLGRGRSGVATHTELNGSNNKQFDGNSGNSGTEVLVSDSRQKWLASSQQQWQQHVPRRFERPEIVFKKPLIPTLSPTNKSTASSAGPDAPGADSIGVNPAHGGDLVGLQNVWSPLPETDPFAVDEPGNSLMGNATSASATRVMCLQYVTVEHDVACSHRARRDLLTTQHLTSLLQHHGASASSPYTAPSLQAAVSGFRNLMTLGIPSVDEHIHFKFTTHQIQTLLDKHHAFNSQSGPVKFRSARQSAGNEEKDIYQGNGTASSGEGSYRHETVEPLSLPSVFLKQMVPMNRLNTRKNRLRKKRFLNPLDQQSYACEYSVDCQHFDASHCPSNQTEMALDHNNCETCRCRDQDAMDGYCQTLSSQSGESSGPLVKLCTQCQQIRHLGQDVFPSFVQEVLCHSSQNSCLHVAGVAHGQCQDTQVPMVFLRRNPNSCMRIQLTNGETLVSDDWQVFQGMIKTGCQCMVDKRSPMAPTVIGK